MKLLDVICEELGVEIEEEWLGDDGKKYKIFKTGDLMERTKYSGWVVADIRQLLSGKINPFWGSDTGDYY